MATARHFLTAGRKIVAIGRNYSEHAKELGNAIPKAPFFFLKPTSSYVTSPGKIEIPKGCIVHHEVELGVVIGKTGRDIPAVEANQYVAGYVLADIVKKKGLPWSAAKGFDTFTPVGNFISNEAIPNPDDVNLWLKVDGETRQDGNTRDMMFKIPQLVEHVSGIMRLEPGDLILTGTPKGVGPISPGQKMTAGLQLPHGSLLSEIQFEAVERQGVFNIEHHM
ncbi:hypothetical protein BDF22DRAFT_739795 [Syncephalis plumigaleata]|nr:hypothetical protein BDF22DRAFT_739795 [Syncephalis plumigaleata]